MSNYNRLDLGDFRAGSQLIVIMVLEMSGCLETFSDVITPSLIFHPSVLSGADPGALHGRELTLKHVFY